MAEAATRLPVPDEQEMREWAQNIMVEQNLSQTALAKLLNMSSSSGLNQFLKGTYPSPETYVGRLKELRRVMESSMRLHQSHDYRPTSISEDTLEGARITLQYEIETSPGTWTPIPLGIYYATDTPRQRVGVRLKGFDGMVRLDVDLTGVATSGTPEGLAYSIANRVGMVLAPLPAELPNKDITLTIPPDSEIATCRDLLMWVCQACGAFARINRAGALEICMHGGSGTPVRIIPAQARRRTVISDNIVHITQVSMPVGDDIYTRGTEGMIMALEPNPLMASLDATTIIGMLDAIVAALGSVQYIPYSVDMTGDPALQPGERIILADTTSAEGDIETIITHSKWKYRGTQTVRGEGKSGLLRAAGSQQNKTVAALKAAAAKLRLAVDENRDDIQAAYAELQAAIEQTATDIISTTTTAIQETATGLLQTVAQQYTAQSAHAALEALLQSAIAQTATDIEFAFSNATTYTIEVDDKIEEYINHIANYIRFSGAGIELGELGSAFTSLFSNTRLSFKQNGVEIAYVANNRLYITDGQFTSSIALGNPVTGNFVWHLEENGSMSLSWRAWGDD